MSKEMVKAETKTVQVNGNTGEMVDTRPSMEEISQKVKNYMDSKERKVFFNGRRYAEFDDLLFIAPFYGLTVRTFEPQYVEIGGKHGFRAKAIAVDENNIERGRAESFCFDDEPNWARKPLFQLASMAQTRAGSKALSNIFRPIIRMAGYEGSPAEEMIDEPTPAKKEIPFPSRPVEAYEPTNKEIEEGEEIMSEEVASQPPPDDVAWDDPKTVAQVAKVYKKASDLPGQKEKKPGTISDKQGKLLYAKRKTANIPDSVWKSFVKDTLGVESDRDIDWHDMDKCIQWIDRYKAL